MGAELLLALGVPLLLMLGFTVLLLEHPGSLPGWMQRLSRREALLWNSGVGLIIALGAARYVMTR